MVEKQGFSQGFDSFNETDCRWGSAECALKQALQVIEEHPIENLFLWVHLFAPHFDLVGNPPRYIPPKDYNKLFLPFPGKDKHEETIADYDREIRYTDDQIRIFFEKLTELNIIDRFLIIIAADHGEEFFEKGRFGHGGALTNTLINVPLIFRMPDKSIKNTVVDEVVSNIDIMPTILDLINLPFPDTIEGRSLRKAIEGGKIGPRVVYSEDQRTGTNIRSIIDSSADRKLIVNYKTNSKELYSLKADYNETNNLSSQFPEQTDEMKKRLEKLINEMKDRAITEVSKSVVSEEELNKLKDLGYVQ